MKIEVKFLSSIRNITGVQGIELSCSPGDTVCTVIQKLVEKFGKKFELATIEGNGLKSLVNIIINGRNINFMDGLDTELKDGDIMVIIPPMAGG